MSEIKLNTWTWGVVPELDPEAVVAVGGLNQVPQDDPLTVSYRGLGNKRLERWYAVLSLGPPEMPEEELRLPEGWEVIIDGTHITRGVYMIEVRPTRQERVGDFCAIVIQRHTRAECVREINRILGGER